jgi:hypothetical protein
MTFDSMLSLLWDVKSVQRKAVDDITFLNSSSCDCRTELARGELICVVCGGHLQRFLRLLILGVLCEDQFPSLP